MPHKLAVMPHKLAVMPHKLAHTGRSIASRPLDQVMTSKQRPRRLAVTGSDGVEYVFLLKGHEDLRQVSPHVTPRDPT
eukprot:3779781-Prymnesium_polylepis.1